MKLPCSSRPAACHPLSKYHHLRAAARKMKKKNMINMRALVAMKIWKHARKTEGQKRTVSKIKRLLN